MFATSVRETDVSQGPQAFMNIVETPVAVAAVRRMSSASNALTQLGDDVAWVEAAVAAPGFFKAGHHVGNEVLDRVSAFLAGILGGIRVQWELDLGNIFAEVLDVRSGSLGDLSGSRNLGFAPASSFSIRFSLSAIRVVAQADQFRPGGHRGFHLPTRWIGGVGSGADDRSMGACFLAHQISMPYSVKRPSRALDLVQEKLRVAANCS
jgi:hypothetical protein